MGEKLLLAKGRLPGRRHPQAQERERRKVGQCSPSASTDCIGLASAVAGYPRCISLQRVNPCDSRCRSAHPPRFDRIADALSPFPLHRETRKNRCRWLPAGPHLLECRARHLARVSQSRCSAQIPLADSLP